MRKCKCVQIVDKEDGCFLNATASVFLGVVGIVSVQGSGNELVGRCSAEKKGEEKKKPWSNLARDQSQLVSAMLR